MSKRLEMIAQELEKLRKKRSRVDEQIRDLEEKYKETENTEIHEIVHAANLTPEQLAKVLISLQHGLPQGRIPGDVLGKEEIGAGSMESSIPESENDENE